MTKRQGKFGTIDGKAVLAEDEEFLRALMRTALQEVLEAEMTEALSAEKGERTAGRLGYRSGYYGRTLITRIGKLEAMKKQTALHLENNVDVSRIGVMAAFGCNYQGDIAPAQVVSTLEDGLAIAEEAGADIKYFSLADLRSAPMRH